jgi:hypothetical protein
MTRSKGIRDRQSRFEELFSGQHSLERATLHLLQRIDSLKPAGELECLRDAVKVTVRLWRELEAERNTLAAGELGQAAGENKPGSSSRAA